MKVVHIMAGLGPTSGVANVARRFARVQNERGEEAMLCASAPSPSDSSLTSLTWPRSMLLGFVYFSWGMLFGLPRIVRESGQVWVHCSWTFPVWYGAWLAKRHGKKLVVVPEASFDPKRLHNHAGWKKHLVRPLDRWVIRQADEVLALCPDELQWVWDFEPKAKVRFARVPLFLHPSPLNLASRPHPSTSSLNVLFLGRAADPLKGLRYLEQAVNEINNECIHCPPTLSTSTSLSLRAVSDHTGAELEADWDWCDVLCLPTLSDNFGLVVAEALERGKRVITTDGAPAWGDLGSREEGVGIRKDQLVYLRGYRDGTDEQRVALLKDALHQLCPAMG